jgi:hypothetical protein
MAKRSGGFTEPMVLAAEIPWQASARLALVSGVTFHLVAIKTAAPIALTAAV